MRHFAKQKKLKAGSARKAKRRRVIDWSKADWRLRDVEIAEQLRVSPSSVGYRREQVGAPRPAKWHKRRDSEKHLVEWRRWDWTKRNIELALERGLSRERIRQIRELVGAPKSPRHYQRRVA